MLEYILSKIYHFLEQLMDVWVIVHLLIILLMVILVIWLNIWRGFFK